MTVSCRVAILSGNIPNRESKGVKQMIGKKMQDALNTHIQAEFYSSYLYVAMAVHCESAGFKGFGAWLRIQAVEERR